MFQLFQGNYDRNSEVKHVLVDGFLAKYLRFLPKTRHNSVCMRTEVFGVRLEPGRHLNVTFKIRLEYCFCCKVGVFVIHPEVASVRLETTSLHDSTRHYFLFHVQCYIRDLENCNWFSLNYLLKVALPGSNTLTDRSIPPVHNLSNYVTMVIT